MIRNSRKVFLHKLSRDIVRKNQVICIKDLNVKGMVKNRKLSKSISDSSWGTLVDFLESKCKWYGKTLQKGSPGSPRRTVPFADGEIGIYHRWP